MSLIKYSELKWVKLITSTPSGRYIPLPEFGSFLMPVGFYNYVEGGSYTFSLLMDGGFFCSVPSDWSTLDDNNVYLTSNTDFPYFGRSFVLDLGSIFPPAGTPCTIVIFCLVSHYISFALKSFFDVFSQGISLNSTQSALLSGTAKKEDLQFTDSANKTWELMDLITANLPFRYSD